MRSSFWRMALCLPAPACVGNCVPPMFRLRHGAMVKTKRRYVCQACGSVSHRWQGQCTDCAEWNTLVEDAPASVFSLKHDLSSGGRAIAFEALDAPSEPLVR